MIFRQNIVGFLDGKQDVKKWPVSETELWPICCLTPGPDALIDAAVGTAVRQKSTLPGIVY